MNDAPGSPDLCGVILGMFEEAAVLVAAYDPGDRLRFANAAFREAFGLDADETPLWAEVMRRNHAAGRGTVIRNPDFDAWLVSTLSRRGKTGFRAYETDLVDGRWLWMEESVGANGWMLCVASDITSLRADDRSIRQDRDLAMRAAFTDELTGISNRRHVLEQMRAMIGGDATIDGLVGCIAILDLDHFKEVNDRYGHHIGDDLLRDCARRIQAELRRSDGFGRIGGEEFVLVLPGTEIGDAEAIVERMLEIVRNARPVPGNAAIRYTFSAGLAEVYADDHPEDAIRRADQALYTAKLGGRDRVNLYGLPRGAAKAG